MTLHRRSLTLLAALICAPAGAAELSDYSSYYAGFGVNVSLAGQQNVSGKTTGSIDYKTAVPRPNLFFGYRPQAWFSDRGDVRLELELSSRGLDVDRTRSGGVTGRPDTAFNTGAIMTNVLYDFHTSTAFTPYAGLGVGVASASFTKDPGLGISNRTAKNSVFAYQAKLGVSYEPQVLPNTSWFVGYSFFNTASKFEFESAGGRVSLDPVASSTFELGFLYHF